MSFHSPRKLKLTESDPSSIDHYHVRYLAEGTGDVVSDATYPSDPSGLTVIPIGSNGSMNNLAVGQHFQIEVREQKDGVDADPQFAVNPSDGTHSFENVLLPDGAEVIDVEL